MSRSNLSDQGFLLRRSFILCLLHLLLRLFEFLLDSLQLFTRLVQTLLLVTLTLSTGLVSTASTATSASTSSTTTTATATASSSSSVAVIKPFVIPSILLGIIDEVTVLVHVRDPLVPALLR